MVTPDPPLPPRAELLDLYKVALDEYRFQVNLNWSRTQYYLTLNVGIISIATGILQISKGRVGDLTAGLYCNCSGSLTVASTTSATNARTVGNSTRRSPFRRSLLRADRVREHVAAGAGVDARVEAGRLGGASRPEPPQLLDAAVG